MIFIFLWYLCLPPPDMRMIHLKNTCFHFFRHSLQIHIIFSEWSDFISNLLWAEGWTSSPHFLRFLPTWIFLWTLPAKIHMINKYSCLIHFMISPYPCAEQRATYLAILTLSLSSLPQVQEPAAVWYLFKPVFHCYILPSVLSCNLQVIILDPFWDLVHCCLLCLFLWSCRTGVFIFLHCYLPSDFVIPLHRILKQI